MGEGSATADGGGGRLFHRLWLLNRRCGTDGQDRGGRDRARGGGGRSVSLCDTVGYGNPAQIKEVVRAVHASIGGKLTRLHLHDTCGLGLANALAGLEEGIRNFDASLAGLGGCPYAPGASGNIVTEDLVFMLESMGFDTGIDLPKLLEARTILRDGLPKEPMHGQLPKAGIPKTFRIAA